MTAFTFPQGFFWGSATSAHQVEGHNTNNDWWVWEQQGRTIDPSGEACDQYRRFRDDFDLAKSLGHTAHRFSIEWSRVEPREDEWNGEAIAHYQEVVRALRERHLEPIVTLHHFTTPLWMAAQGGWTNPKIVERFMRYSRTMAEALGGQVRYWVTINEPMVYATMHYLDGVGPPGKQDLGLTFLVMEHLVRAHAASYHAIHQAVAAQGRAATVAIAMHWQQFVPHRRWWPPDRLVGHATEQVYNFRFVDAIMEGRLRVPGRRPVRIPNAHETMDFLGVHYYGRAFMRQAPGRRGVWAGARCGTDHHREVTERNFLGWDVYPRGLYEILHWATRYGRPIFVTENGICTQDDRQRERFILRHVQWVARAMQEGVPVMGYLYWSLLDNFEWAKGFAPRFGMIEVDYRTQERRARDSARRFAQLIQANRADLPDG